MEKTSAVSLRNVRKTFGEVVANEKVSLELYRGEILSLLGENGSGKTTLMNMLAGIYLPDSGEIWVNGIQANIRSPKDSFSLGIGMIHQHFKLVEVFTATENIVLGLPGKLNRKAAAQEIAAIAGRYGFELDPQRKIYEMSVAEKQTVEIVKALYRGADILILDEPTAVLTPQETEKLFAVLRNMRADGKAVVIITHKLHEVMAISDRVSVLRRGEFIGTLNTAETNPQELTNMMVGRMVSLNIDRPKMAHTPRRLEVSGISVTTPDGVAVLRDASFTLRGGEILGVAGIAGSGQKELCEAVAGLCPVAAGSVIYFPPDREDQGDELLGKSPLAIRQLGISLAFVPEDRLGMGLVGNMGLVDNMMLKSYRRGRGPVTDRKPSKALAEEIVRSLEVNTPGVNTPVRRLSGGNVQKVLVGREISSLPTVLMVAYPVRGLDINSAYTIYRLLNEQKQAGVGVLFVGEDLDVLLELCDRIVVLCGGKVTGVVDAATVTKEEVGLLMTQNRGEEGSARG